MKAALRPMPNPTESRKSRAATVHRIRHQINMNNEMKDLAIKKNPNMHHWHVLTHTHIQLDTHTYTGMLQKIEITQSHPQELQTVAFFFFFGDSHFTEITHSRTPTTRP